jgi:FkbM family methyltransferase
VSNAWEVLRSRRKQRHGQTIEVRLRDGHRFYLPGGKRDFRMFTRIYVQDEHRVARLRDARWECVVDLGANAGYFATLVGSRARRVICYEPIPENFVQLQKNTESWPNIIAVCQAVHGTRSTIRLYHAAKGGTTGRYSTYPVPGVHLPETFTEVPAVTLDDVFDQHQIVLCDLLKIDVEGAEYEVLYAARDTTLSKIQRICGEYHDTQSDDPTIEIGALSAFLRSKGFEVEVAPRRKHRKHGPFFATRAAANESRQS